MSGKALAYRALVVVLVVFCIAAVLTLNNLTLEVASLALLAVVLYMKRSCLFGSSRSCDV